MAWRLPKVMAKSGLAKKMSCLFTVFMCNPGFSRRIGKAGLKAAGMLAKPPVPSFTRRVRQELAT